MRILAVGAGVQLEYYLREAIVPTSGVELVGCVDVDAGRRHAFAAAHGVSAFATVAAAEAVSPDIYYVATPAHVRLDVVEDICRVVGDRRVAIMCEKPIAVTLGAALKLVSVAHRQGHVITCNLDRYQIGRAVADRVGALLGKVVEVDAAWELFDGTPARGTFLDPALGGGVAMDLAPHPVALVQGLLGRGAEPTHVQDAWASRRLAAAGGTRGLVSPADHPVEDAFGARWRLHNGAPLTIEVRWDGHVEPRFEIRILGTEGAATVTLVQDGDEHRFHVAAQTVLGGERATVRWPDEPSVMTLAEAREYLLFDLATTLADRRRGGAREPLVTPSLAIANLAAILAAKRLAGERRTGPAVELPTV